MNLRGVLNFFEITAAAAFDVKPEAALAFWRGKGLRPTFSYADMAASEHDTAFTVAKMLDIDLLKDVQESLEAALADGVPFKEWADQIMPLMEAKGWWGRKGVRDPLTGQTIVSQLGSPGRLKTIFRTNLQTAYAAGQWVQIQDQAADAPYLMYDAVDDYRTRDAHRALDGRVLPVADKFWRTHYPPLGYNCFPAEQPISGNFEIGLKAWYSGDMFKLTTGKGHTLTVTANHPVLTSRGWVKAKDLAEGDGLFAYIGEGEVAALRGVEHKNAPARSDDVFDALVAKGIPRLTLGGLSPLDLYGDAEHGDCEVDVVGADRILRNDIEAGSLQDLGEDALAVADPLRHALVKGAGTLGPLFEASLPSTASAPCGSALAGNSGGVGLERGPLDALLLGTGADSHASSDKKAPDSASVNSDPIGKAFDAFAGQIVADELIGIVRYEFSGHVYDFQTDTGMILASRIVTSNCRCGVIQLSDDDLEEMGLKVSKSPRIKTENWTNPRTGKTERVPVGVDPGFDHNPGMARETYIRQLLGEKVAALPDGLKDAAKAGIAATMAEAAATVPAKPKKLTKAQQLQVQEDRALQDLARSFVMPSSASPDGVREFLDAVEDTNQRFGMGKASYIGDPTKGPIRYRLGQRASAAYAPATDAILFRAKTSNAKDEARIREQNEAYAKRRGWAATSDLLRKAFNNEEAARIADSLPVGRPWTFNHSAKGISYHEMGHRLHAFNRQQLDVILQAGYQKGWHHLVSEYGTTNRSEFMAEAFAIYMTGTTADMVRIYPPLLEWLRRNDRRKV